MAPPEGAAAQLVDAAEAAPPHTTPPALSERLLLVRAMVDNIATKHCQARQGLAPAPDLGPVAEYVREAEAMFGQLGEADLVQANMIVGCGWQMLGDEARVFRPLMHVAEAPSGSIALHDQLTAIMILTPVLRKQRLWELIVRISDRAHALAHGKWFDPTLPYIKGIALAKLHLHSAAAASFEASIGMVPTFQPPYTEYNAAMSSLGEVSRCREMAQKLVDQGGRWVDSWQRPDHFFSEVPLASTPWHDPSTSQLARNLEEAFGAIRAEAEPVCAGTPGWRPCSSAFLASGDMMEITILGSSPDACTTLFPQLARSLEAIPEAAECAGMRLGMARLLRLGPGARLRPRCGPSNMRLTCHLGVRVPERCTITCGGQPRAWEEGRCIVFDDSFEHEAENGGGEPLVVLAVHFWHPGVPRERRQQLAEGMPAGDDEDDGYRALFEAVRSAGGLVSRKLCRGSRPPLHVPGLVAAEPISAGEELLRIPTSLHISPETVMASKPELWQAVQELPDLPAGRRAEVAQTVFVAGLLEAEGCVDGGDCGDGGSQLPAAGGQQQAPEVLEVWRRYGAVLRGEDFAAHPYRQVAADPEAMRATLEPSPEAQFFVDSARDILSIHQVVTEKLPVAAGRPPEVGAFLRARLCLLTRQVRARQDSTLVPAFDLLNHGTGVARGVSWWWDEEGQATVAVADRAHALGEELRISYGPRSNVILYRTYGFTQPPDVEPAWSYILWPSRVPPASSGGAPLPGRVVLDSRSMDRSLCEALTAVGRDRGGREPAKFLRAVCEHCKQAYERDGPLQPALEALARVRAVDPARHEWWRELGEADRSLATKDEVRVKMSEYLSLVAHLEVIGVLDKTLEEGRCLKGADTLKKLLAEAFRILGEERCLCVEQIPNELQSRPCAAPLPERVQMDGFEQLALVQT